MVFFYKESFATKSVTFLPRRPRQEPTGWTVANTDDVPPAAEESANEDTVLQDKPPLQPERRELGSEDTIIRDDNPAHAGIFTDVWDGSLDGTRVVLKSYRFCSTADSTRPRTGPSEETLARSPLSHRNIVPSRAIYTTPKHPPTPVCDSAGHTWLGEYANGDQDTKKLVDAIRGLEHMRDLGIIHGKTTIDDLLVDHGGIARPAGLEPASDFTRNERICSQMKLPRKWCAPTPTHPEPKRPKGNASMPSPFHSSSGSPSRVVFPFQRYIRWRRSTQCRATGT